MTRWGMVIDLDKCTACQACSVACKAENSVSFSTPEEAYRGQGVFWQQVLAIPEGEYPKAKIRFLPRPCMHCENPPCVAACPTGAFYKREDGLVLINYALCNGSEYCTIACPYGVPQLNRRVYSPPSPMGQYLNPDVPVRKAGVVEKCTFCVQRIEQAQREGRKVGSDGEAVPACVQTCPAQALYFGDLEDPTSTVYKLSRSPRGFRLRDELGTRPQVYYLKEGP